MPRHTVNSRAGLRSLGSLLATGALLALGAGAASASTSPPAPSPALFGTWVNTNPKTPNLKTIAISPSGSALLVDASGACSPTPCEWGAVPATLFGPNVSSATGSTFETRQTFAVGSRVWSETELIGRLSSAYDGPPCAS